MQINTNYDTLNFNGKVNFLTMVRNHFSKVGKYANQEIAEIRASHPKVEINQEAIGDKIELSFYETSQTGRINAKTIVSKDGIEETEVSGSRLFGIDNRYNLIHNIKRIFAEHDINISTIVTETQSVVNTITKKVEEVATKETNLYGPVKIEVLTKSHRESTFPMTTIAKNLHPAQATKQVNSDGDILYIENYPKP